jgi:CBS domain-containing protein
MKVQEIMTRDVAACRLDSDLAHVAAEMFHRDCGCLPVVSADGHIAGIVTDRDIAVALSTTERPANRIPVREVMSSPVVTCAPQDETRSALDTMRTRKVRRLPVVDDDGHLKGVLSLNDVVRAAETTADSPSSGDVLAVMKSLCAHDDIVVSET